MASSDSELTAEVRSFTDYRDNELSDSDIQGIINVAKEEIRAYLGDASFTFYGQGTHQADRALFWFSCIGTKVRTGELGGIDLTIDDLEARDSAEEYSFWISNFFNRLSSASTGGVAGASSTQITRDDERTYSYDQP